ncbi:MAG: uracil-DNA glycosylase [Deltaproteobacteria bacterium]|nr:uracil-DNA glycosylase [Deltaproteobacteria bacterium]MBW2483098.1 uracil-DNA glycosylase [Deltaproteobacteria bacterium]
MTVSCHKCLHYYVTWDPQFPHGCRIMGFKSKRMPAIDVRRTMDGKNCNLFKVRNPKISPPKAYNLR